MRPKQHSVAVSSASGGSGPERRWRAAVVAEVAIVSVVDVVPGGVTVAGEKLHFAPAGRPEQLNETAESKPFAGVTVIVAVPLCPAVTVSDVGAAAMEKFGGNSMV